MNENRNFFENQNMKLICEDGTCAVYQLKNETGDGTMTSYQVYPGIYILYNDFHMDSCPSRKFEKGADDYIISVHHCREGRIEWEIKNGTYLYMADGDVILDNSLVKNRRCYFPLTHFHGITITIAVAEVRQSIADILSWFNIDLSKIKSQYESDETPYSLGGVTALEHILEELYHFPESIRDEYFKIKILELLLILQNTDPKTAAEKRPYFYKNQVDKIKSIMAYMTENPEKHYTVQGLAEQFDISESALKRCFKGVYGSAIYTYMRNYRMDMAAQLLRQGDESITAIAGKVGYSNTSKFAEAFKSVKGKTPLEYRKVRI